MASESLGLRRRPQLSEEVASILRHKIMTAELLPGTPIRMDETALELGVSVTPVREALLTLRGEGMVESAPHRGYVVAGLSRTDVEDVFWLQEQAATRIARRTAGLIDDDQLALLVAANDRLRGAVAGNDAVAITEAEFEFHRTHNRISGSNKLAWFLLAATRYTPHQLYASDPDWAAVTLDSHQRLIEAYRAGDPDDAAAAIAVQFTDGAERLLAHLETTPLWG
ncbi:putative GntR family transcriptional regulator [Gordonia hirsuta DSM 44140 = NBRC 16056]|uniref:Putative GntR family transcriptional regulator n=1 Tax=Gordonia hirsuta DSM 44140 = NBRC 16056 TaxID=1121927 RepID=L7L7I0_9ACTN|nr:GntR family transcriptional regulator [Gordonia hirsuta]GAC57110.1 putative GntR family transcriptional regulator [Gordonia hirsuta DSM 44140 = NBRC 16056]